VLVLTQADGESLTKILRSSLGAIGYTEGQNLEFHVRAESAATGRLDALAAELVGLKVDLIVATFTPCSLAAKRATSTIPIVAVSVGDPIGSGLAKSLPNLGGNVTGLTNLAAETAGKGVELLRDAFPKIRRVAAIANPDDPFTKPFLEHVQSAGSVSGVEIGPIAMVRKPDDFDNAFAAIVAGNAEAVVVQGIYFSKPIADLAIRHRLPTTSVVRAFADVGGLITYGASVPDLFQRSAYFVQKILQGAKPADLPIEQPTQFELAVNLKTAKAIGVTIPESLLLRASTVIE
jgi:putative ABC transport system substrate-binding protein